MEHSSYTCEALRPPFPPIHHHRHQHHHCHHHPVIISSHHHHAIFCPLHHHHHLITCHSHVSRSVAPLPLLNQLNSGSTPVEDKAHHSGTLVLQEQDYKGLEEVEEVGDEEEEEEPIFVLTDEWREFFAKSEAKRKLEKQQAKKKQKN